LSDNTHRAPLPRFVIERVISWLSWGEHVHKILSEYPAILDIAASLSLNKGLCKIKSFQLPWDTPAHRMLEGPVWN
jgi:hypothetical protein